MLEEEIKNGDKERESLRIENQRLRDELSEVRIETDIVQERLRNAEWHGGGRRRKPTPLHRTPSTPQTPEIFDRSPATSTVSSPLFHTPPMKASLASVAATPPSPPMSETSSMRKSINAVPGFPRQKASGSESFGTRSLHGPRTQRYPSHSRATSVAYSNGWSTPSVTSRPSLTKPNNGPAPRPSALPKSGSLCQIRGLIGKMQKLEERVQSAKSKLPPPSDSPSRGSSRAGSRAGSILGSSPMGSTITPRDGEARQRLSSSSFSSSLRDGDGMPSYLPHRPSFSQRTQGDSRPSSRTSFSSSFSQSTHPSVAPSSTRPESRQSRTKTPLGHYSTNPTTESRRPRSSLSNPSAQGAPVNGMSHIDEDEDLAMRMSVRAKISEARQTRLPSIPTQNGVKKRTPSNMSAIPTPRTLRMNGDIDRRENMGPPNHKATPSDLGETF